MAIILLPMVIPPHSSLTDCHWETVIVLLSLVTSYYCLSLWYLPVCIPCLLLIWTRSGIGDCRSISGIRWWPLRIGGYTALIGNPTKLFIPLKSPSMAIELLWLLLLWFWMADWCYDWNDVHIRWLTRITKWVDPFRFLPNMGVSQCVNSSTTVTSWRQGGSTNRLESTGRENQYDF